MTFTSGKYAWAICDRCGFRSKYLAITEEMGTKWRVCRACDDGPYSLVAHPQNRVTPNRVDPQGLEHARSDVVLEVPTSLSAGLIF